MISSAVEGWWVRTCVAVEYMCGHSVVCVCVCVYVRLRLVCRETHRSLSPHFPPFFSPFSFPPFLFPVRRGQKADGCGAAQPPQCRVQGQSMLQGRVTYRFNIQHSHLCLLGSVKTRVRILTLKRVSPLLLRLRPSVAHTCVRVQSERRGRTSRRVPHLDLPR